MQYLTNYTAPPARDAFKPADMKRLVEIATEIANASRSALQTEWSAAAWRTDDECVGRAIGAINAGQSVLVAQDEDGWYFAVDCIKLTGDDAARYGAMNLLPRADDGSIELHGPHLVLDDTTTATETADHCMIQAGPDSDFIRIEDTAVIRALYDHPSACADGDGAYMVSL